MIRTDQIPHEVVEAAARATWESWRMNGREKAPVFEDLQPWIQEEERTHARASLAAALNAWPGMEHQTPDGWSNKPHIILPLPQESENAEA